MKTLLLISPLLAGCNITPDVKSEWVSVEKPPIRVVYISRKIDPNTVSRIIEQTKLVPYKDYKFNDSTIIKADATAHKSASALTVSTVGVDGRIK